MFQPVSAMDTYSALTPMNYDTLQLNTTKLESLRQDDLPQYTSRSLVTLCSAAICHMGTEEAAEAILAVPAHLAPTLLQTALQLIQPTAITAFIANWPLPLLCFRDLIPNAANRDIFKEEMGLDLVVFKGVTARTRKCRMACLDLRGFVINATFMKLIIQMWPLLSLRKSQRNIKRLTSHVLKVAGLKNDIRLAKEIIPKLLQDLLGHDMANHPTFSIQMGRGDKMTVQVDQLEFSSQNTFFMDYLLTSCLRSITPVQIIPTSIVIKSELNIGDEILDSLAPFIVFRGHDPDCLEGVWLENLEDNVFFIFCQDLHRFSNIKAVGFPNCNIMLQEGRTRQRTSARTQLTTTLAHFPNLVRLDISRNSFTGCLHEILDALACPLEYLSLKECDLVDSDLIKLSESKHAGSLRQLNIAKICGLFPDDNFAIATSTMVRCLKNFPKLTVAHLQQNQITNPRVQEICRTIREDWTCMKSINICDNIISPDFVLRLVQAACDRPSMQFLKLPYAHNMLEDNNLMETGRQEFVRRIDDILKNNNRTDIEVEVKGLAYAVFVNL